MSKLKKISLNQFQLARLLDDEQMSLLKVIIDENVFCTHCVGICNEGISAVDTNLNSQNDIQIHGICNKCNGSVSRIIEFGVDKAFYEKATEFRK